MPSSGPDPNSQSPGGFDWRGRYVDADTPWDLGRAHPELERRLEAGELGSGAAGSGLAPSAFVPGCGRGHDAVLLAEAGFKVTALDLVGELAAELGPQLDSLGGRFVVGDALEFAPDALSDLFFEHTFFCALPPERRGAWGALARRVVRPGGMLAALVFPASKPLDHGGPPFGTTTRDLAAALGSDFELELDEPVQARVERRNWAERWARFRRLSNDRS